MPFFKSKIINAKQLKPGISLPKAAIPTAYPEAGSVQEALDDLRRAVARTKTERMTANHPAFGKKTHEEWNTLHLRHSEMHLSFALPK
jgi:fructose-bisphosphate aldolase class 1